MFRKLVLAAALLAGAGMSQAAMMVTLTPSVPTVTAGNPFSVSIDIAGVTDLFAWEMDIEFGAVSVVNATTQTEGTFLGAGTTFVPGSVDNSLGTITFIGSSLSGGSGVTGNGSLASIAFNTLAEGTASFTFSRVLLLDSNLDTIFIDNQTEWFGGSIEILPPAPPPGVPLPGTLALCVLALGALRVARRAQA
jgi:hypothetical protein